MKKTRITLLWFRVLYFLHKKRKVRVNSRDIEFVALARKQISGDATYLEFNARGGRGSIIFLAKDILAGSPLIAQAILWHEQKEVDFLRSPISLKNTDTSSILSAIKLLPQFFGDENVAPSVVFLVNLISNSDRYPALLKDWLDGGGRVRKSHILALCEEIRFINKYFDSRQKVNWVRLAVLGDYFFVDRYLDIYRVSKIQTEIVELCDRCDAI